MGEKVVGFKASEGEFDQAQFSDTLIRCHLSFFIVAYTNVSVKFKRFLTIIEKVYFINKILTYPL